MPVFRECVVTFYKMATGKTKLFSFQKRADRTSSSHCSVPRCSASAKYNSVLSFFTFPKEDDLRRKWVTNIRRDNFIITNNTRVCSRHFLPSHMAEPPSPKGRRLLKTGAVPVLFEWNHFSLPVPQPGVSDSNKQKPNSSSKDRIRLQRVQKGHGRYCNVPLCSVSGRFNGAISLHKFPKDPGLRTQWLANIRRLDLEVTGNTSLCSRHFESGMVTVSPAGRRYLTPNAVPTLFHWNNYRSSQLPSVRGRPGDYHPGTQAAAAAVAEHDYAISSEAGNKELQGQSLQLSQSFCLERFCSSPQDFCHFTGFPSYQHLVAFWSLIQEETVRMITAQKHVSSSTSSESPLTRPTELLLIDELFLFLNFLATGCTQRELSLKFQVDRSTVSQIIVTWAHFLYTLLGSVSIWMSSAAVKRNRPRDFDGAYGNTQVILDCVEVRCQTPSAPLPQIEVFSHESHCTFKALVGLSPHGALTFVSSLFHGSISDRELFRHSGIASLLTPDMDVMVDRGFFIDELVPGKVHRPAFLFQPTQMSEVDVLKAQSVARLRVHVKRLLGRVKENKLLDTILPLSISGSINQVFAVSCLLTNYQHGPNGRL